MSEKSDPPPFRCEVEPLGERRVRVRPAGELDMATGPVLERQLRQAHADGFKEIVLDLRGLDFMDSTGITLLTRWSLDASRDGFSFSLVPGSERIQRLFDLTGLHGYFTFVDG